MKNWVPPSVKSCSKNGELPKTKPERVEKPSTNFTLDVGRAPSVPIGAYQCPSRSMRWKSPLPPRRPPLCEIPAWTIVPAVGNGRAIPVSRHSDTPTGGRTQFVHGDAAADAVFLHAPANVSPAMPDEADRRETLA